MSCFVCGLPKQTLSDQIPVFVGSWPVLSDSLSCLIFWLFLEFCQLITSALQTKMSFVFVRLRLIVVDMQIQYRWRQCRAECTGSLPTSEVKRRRARLVPGRGTAQEDLRVLSAFFPFPRSSLDPVTLRLSAHTWVTWALEAHGAPRTTCFQIVWACEFMVVVKRTCLETKPASWTGHSPVHAARIMWNTSVAVIGFAVRCGCLSCFCVFRIMFWSPFQKTMYWPMLLPFPDHLWAVWSRWWVLT